MSKLLEEIIADLKAKRIEYEAYLKRIADSRSVFRWEKTDDTPGDLDTPGKRALYDNLGEDLALALAIDEVVKRVRPDDFRGNRAKENVIKEAMLPLLNNDLAEMERIFLIIAEHKKEY